MTFGQVDAQIGTPDESPLNAYPVYSNGTANGVMMAPGLMNGLTLPPPPAMPGQPTVPTMSPVMVPQQPMQPIPLQAEQPMQPMPPAVMYPGQFAPASTDPSAFYMSAYPQPAMTMYSQ